MIWVSVRDKKSKSENHQDAIHEKEHELIPNLVSVVLCEFLDPPVHQAAEWPRD